MAHLEFPRERFSVLTVSLYSEQNISPIKYASIYTDASQSIYEYILRILVQVCIINI